MEKRRVLSRYDLVFGEKRHSRVIGGQLTIVTLALHTCGENQSAYFSATYEQYIKDKPDRHYRDNGISSCGCGVEEFAHRFPKIAPYFGWHLVSIDSGPIHYVANAKFWYEKYVGGGDHGRYGNNWDAARCLQAAESCAHWGMLPGEEPGGLQMAVTDFQSLYDEGELMTESALKSILDRRFDSLMAKYKLDMTTLFGDEAVAEAVAHAEELRLKKEEKR